MYLTMNVENDFEKNVYGDTKLQHVNDKIKDNTVYDDKTVRALENADKKIIDGLDIDVIDKFFKEFYTIVETDEKQLYLLNKDFFVNDSNFFMPLSHYFPMFFKTDKLLYNLELPKNKLDHCVFDFYGEKKGCSF